MSHNGTASIDLQSALSGGSLKKPFLSTSRFALQRNIRSGKISRGARVNFADKLTMFTPPPTPPTSALSVTLPVGGSPVIDVTQALSETLSPVKKFLTVTELSPTAPISAESVPHPPRPSANARNAHTPAKGVKTKSLTNFSELLLMFMAIIFGVCVIYIISRIIKITRNVRCIEHTIKAAARQNNAPTFHSVTVSPNPAFHADGVAGHDDGSHDDGVASLEELGHPPSMVTTPFSVLKMVQPQTQSNEGEPINQSMSTLPNAELEVDDPGNVGGAEFSSSESDNQAPVFASELEFVEIGTTLVVTGNKVNTHAHADAEGLGPDQEISMDVEIQPVVPTDNAHVDVTDSSNSNINSDAGKNQESHADGADQLLHRWKCELAQHNPFLLEVITNYPENVVVMGDVPTVRLCEPLVDDSTSPSILVDTNTDTACFNHGMIPESTTSFCTVVLPVENTHDYFAVSTAALSRVPPLSCSFHPLNNDVGENAQQPLSEYFERTGDELFEFDTLELHAELEDLNGELGDMNDCNKMESICDSPVENPTADLCSKSERPLVDDSVLASSGFFTPARASSSDESEGSDSAVDDEPSSKQRGENSVSVARIVTQGIEPLQLILESMQQEMLSDERRHDTNKSGGGGDFTQTSDTSDSDSGVKKTLTTRKTRASKRPDSKATLVTLLTASTDNVKQTSRVRSNRSKTIGQAADKAKTKPVREKKTKSNQGLTTTQLVFI